VPLIKPGAERPESDGGKGIFERVAVSNVRVRPQPCTRCGEKVIIIETRAAGLGGLWRLTPATRVEHADFERGREMVDHVDDACPRGNDPRP
jgi:hypothetical protein